VPTSFEKYSWVFASVASNIALNAYVSAMTYGAFVSVYHFELGEALNNYTDIDFLLRNGANALIMAGILPRRENPSSKNNIEWFFALLCFLFSRFYLGCTLLRRGLVEVGAKVFL
jgi:hypothetical protein